MESNNRLPIILILLTLLCLSTGFSFGIYFNQDKVQPLEIIKYIEVEKIVQEPVVRIVEKLVPMLVEVPIEVPVEVEVEKRVETIVTVPIKLYDFASVKELENWLNSRPEPVLALFKASYDCEDVARKMINEAMDDGYYMWMQIVEGPYYSPVSRELLCKSGEAHALCSAIIENDYYFIEPTMKEYWMAYKVD